MIDLDAIYGIKHNLDYYIKQAEYHVQYLEDHAGAPASQAHQALQYFRALTDQLVEQAENDVREDEAQKRVAQFNQNSDWNEKYTAAYDLYYMGKLDESEKMMRQIATAGLEKDNPEMHRCALRSIEEIGRAKVLKQHSSGVEE